MIKVNKKDNIITICGHANSADFGKDIVCASVSSVVYTTVNALKRYSSSSVDFEDNNIMTITILKEDEITKLLIDNMMDLLKSLAEDYPKNIIVKES